MYIAQKKTNDLIDLVTSLEATYESLVSLNSIDANHKALMKLALSQQTNSMNIPLTLMIPSLESDCIPSMEGILGEIGGAITTGAKAAWKSLVKMIMTLVDGVLKIYGFIKDKINKLKKAVILLVAKKDQYVDVKLPNREGEPFKDYKDVIVYYSLLIGNVKRLLSTPVENLHEFQLDEALKKSLAPGMVSQNKGFGTGSTSKRLSIVTMNMKGLEVIDIINKVNECSELLLSKDFQDFSYKVKTLYQTEGGVQIGSRFGSADTNKYRGILDILEQLSAIVSVFAVKTATTQSSYTFLYTQRFDDSAKETKDGDLGVLNGVKVLSTDEVMNDAISRIYEHVDTYNKEEILYGKPETGGISYSSVKLYKDSGKYSILLRVYPLCVETGDRYRDGNNRLLALLLYVETNLTPKQWLERTDIDTLYRPIHKLIKERYNKTTLNDENVMKSLKELKASL